ncbi:MAG: multicopper oxidase family protein, partial [Mycolicibacterium sp.]
MVRLPRRSFLIGSLLAGAGALAACSGPGAAAGAPVRATSPVVRRLEQQRRTPGQ